MTRTPRTISRRERFATGLVWPARAAVGLLLSVMLASAHAGSSRGDAAGLLELLLVLLVCGVVAVGVLLAALVLCVRRRSVLPLVAPIVYTVCAFVLTVLCFKAGEFEPLAALTITTLAWGAGVLVPVASLVAAYAVTIKVLRPRSPARRGGVPPRP